MNITSDIVLRARCNLAAKYIKSMDELESNLATACHGLFTSWSGLKGNPLDTTHQGMKRAMKEGIVQILVAAQEYFFAAPEVQDGLKDAMDGVLNTQIGKLKEDFERKVQECDEWEKEVREAQAKVVEVKIAAATAAGNIADGKDDTADSGDGCEGE